MKKYIIIGLTFSAATMLGFSFHKDLESILMWGFSLLAGLLVAIFLQLVDLKKKD